MKNQEFIEAIKLVVLEGSIKAVESNLESPAGRNPSNKLKELSAWYKNLDCDNKEMVSKIIRECMDTSVFIFCCVLDGVTAIEGYGEKGVLKLYYEKNGKSVLLNDPNETELHDLL